MRPLIYNYDPVTGLCLGAQEPDVNPEYSNCSTRAKELQALKDAGEPVDEVLLTALASEPEFLYPAHTTPIAPPDAPEGQGAYWRGASWVLAPLPAPDAEAPPPVLTPEQEKAKAVADAEALIEEHMEAMARGMGYKGLDRAISYAEEPAVQKYQDEGKALRSWRSRVWAWFYTEDIQLEVADGRFDEDSLLELPPLYPSGFVNLGDPSPA